MNLELLAERACLESGYNDTDDVVAAKKFARHWDEHVWNAALWKDALVVAEVAVDPDTNEDHAEGVIFLPEVIDRVVGARVAANQLSIEAQERYYRMDWDAFSEQGSPVEYQILPPAWLRSPVGLYFQAAEAEDAAAVLKYIFQNNDTGQRYTRELALSTEPDTDVTNDTLLVAAFKPVTVGSVAVKRIDNDAQIAFLLAEQTVAPKYQRLRLLPIPTDAVTVKVLGKAKYEPLEFDQQEPALRNTTNALLAFIRASLNRRGGEMGKSQLEFAEANALLRQVMEIEAVQAANNNRIIPVGGFGPEYGLGPAGYLGM